MHALQRLDERLRAANAGIKGSRVNHRERSFDRRCQDIRWGSLIAMRNDAGAFTPRGRVRRQHAFHGLSCDKNERIGVPQDAPLQRQPQPALQSPVRQACGDPRIAEMRHPWEARLVFHAPAHHVAHMLGRTRVNNMRPPLPHHAAARHRGWQRPRKKDLRQHCPAKQHGSCAPCAGEALGEHRIWAGLSLDHKILRQTHHERVVHGLQRV